MTPEQIAELEAKVLPWLPGYSIHANGEIWSLKPWRGQSKRRLIPHPNMYGYMRVKAVLKNGSRKTLFVAKLVAEAFMPPRPSPSHVLRHLDGNKARNGIGNLAWGTPKQNSADRERHGRTARGEHNGASALTPELARTIREAAGSLRQIASQFGVDQRTVGRIKRREVWGHV